MRNPSVGISDISLYLPKPRLDLDLLVRERARVQPEVGDRLRKALATTGQRSFRFPQEWEDTATFAAQSAKELLVRNPRFDTRTLRYIAVGTESTLDHAKPVAAYVLGMLKKTAFPIPENLSTFQTQHACAAGTLALISVCSQILASGRPDQAGIVISSDVSRYRTFSTAEITQGAGAAAVLVESRPKLIEFDLSTVGHFSRDVDDFFRPLGQETAEVKGFYSIKCYHDALHKAFLDHCAQSGLSPEETLRLTDFFALHTPFRNMPEAGMVKLLSRYLHYDDETAREELKARGLYDGINPVANVGNIYTGSVLLSLAFLLASRYRILGKAVVGKRILLFSYGSGNTMVALGGRIAQGAPEVIEGWNLEGLVSRFEETDLAAYSSWIARSKNGRDPHVQSPDSVPDDSFFLNAVRQDGYREYAYKKS